MAQKFKITVNNWLGSRTFSTQANTYSYLDTYCVSPEALKIVLSKCLSNDMSAAFPNNDEAQSVQALIHIYYKKAHFLERYIKSADCLREIIGLYDLKDFDCIELANILAQIEDVKLFEQRPETPEAALEVGIADFLDLYQLEDGRYVNLSSLPALDVYTADELLKTKAQVM